MKILEKEFKSKGYYFKQILRDGNYAIYEKWNDNGARGLEVIRIKSHQGYSIAGVDILPAEIYTSSEKWGVDAFSPFTLEQAKEKLIWMRDKQFNAPEINQESGEPVKRKRGRPKIKR